MRYIIGIVTYNPELFRLRENIHTAASNTDAAGILLVDNGSENVRMLEELKADYQNLYVIELCENKGIAAALNVIGSEAERLGCDWFMTLDQDSVLQPSIMQTMSQYTDRSEIGIISPRIEDRNYGRQYAKRDHGQEEIEMCITSGNLVRTDTWRECGGFDEQMFIDGVDFDFCLTVREHGKNILRVNDVYLLQEVGHGYARQFMGKTVSILNHSPLRLYYISRNYLYVGKKHRILSHGAITVAKRMLLVTLYEKDKVNKLLYMFRGVRDFILGKMGILST